MGRFTLLSILRMLPCSSLSRAWDVWLMLMRNTSTPATKSFSIISGLDEAGPRVARIFTLRFLRTGNYCPWLVFSPDKEIVQSASSDVSTSKKPVFW